MEASSEYPFGGNGGSAHDSAGAKSISGAAGVRVSHGRSLRSGLDMNDAPPDLRPFFE